MFLCLLKTIDCGYSLEPPRPGSSNEYQPCMFLSENFQFLEMTFSIYLNRLVFVMLAVGICLENSFSRDVDHIKDNVLIAKFVTYSEFVVSVNPSFCRVF